MRMWEVWARCNPDQNQISSHIKSLTCIEYWANKTCTFKRSVTQPARVGIAKQLVYFACGTYEQKRKHGCGGREKVKEPSAKFLWQYLRSLRRHIAHGRLWIFLSFSNMYLSNVSSFSCNTVLIHRNVKWINSFWGKICLAPLRECLGEITSIRCNKNIFLIPKIYNSVLGYCVQTKVQRFSLNICPTSLGKFISHLPPTEMLSDTPLLK